MPSKRITIALLPEHALQYASMLEALTQAGPPHPVFQAMFADLRDRLMGATADQLTVEELEKHTKQP